MIRFKFFNIPVTIHPSFWFFLLFLFGSNLEITPRILIYAGVFTLSLLIHEYGHGLAALFYKTNPEIHLELFSGVTKHSNYDLSDKQNFIITLNGPLFSALLLIFSYLFFKNAIFQNPYINYFLYISYKLNLFWLCFNLMPLYPLDGGKLLRHLLVAKFGNIGIKHSLIIGNIAAVLGLVYTISHQWYFFSFFLAMHGFRNFQALQKSNFSSHKKTTFSLYNESLDALENNEIEKAKTMLKKLLKIKDNNNVKISALESLADILHKEKKNTEAYNLLLQSDHSLLKKGKCLLCKLAYDEKNYILIEKYSRDIYEIDPSYEIAALNSKAYAHLNKPELSGGWLQTASRFEDIQKNYLKNLLNDKIYNKIKNNSSFKKYTQKIIE